MKFRVGVIAFAFVWGVSSWTISQSYAAGKHNSAALDLLKAFSSGCPSYGEWSSTALAQTRALQSVIVALKERGNCGSVSSALTSAQNLGTEIQRLSNDPIQIRLKQAQEMKRQLLIELDGSSDPGVQQILISALAEADVELARAKSESNLTGQNARDTLANGLGQAVSYLNTLLTDPNLSQCALQYPNLGVQIGAGVLAIAGTFVDPSIGVAISALGQLTSNLVTFVRNFKLDSEIWKLQSIEMAVALSCGLESMQNTYCGAQDLYTLASLEASSYPSQWKPTDFWEGLDLWSHKIPGLLLWIEKIATGIRPSDPASAERQNLVWAKVHQLQSIERSTTGLVELTRRLLKNSGSSSDQIAITRRGLSQIINTMYGVDPSNPNLQNPSPVSDFYPNSTILLYTIASHPLDCSPSGGSNPCKNAQTIPLPPGGFEEIASSTRAVFETISKLLLADLHLVIDIDPRGLLVEATQTSTIGEDSPLQVMENTITYLIKSEKFLVELHDPSEKQLLPLMQETRSLLQETVNAVKASSGTPEGAQQTITQIFSTLRLVFGRDFISERLFRHIKWDLTLRLNHGKIPSNISEILRASGRDAAEELNISGKAGLDKLLDDISNAQSVTQQNLENFSDFYAPAFSEVLTRLREAADRAGEPWSGPKRPNRRVQSRLCVLLATGLSEWPKSIDPTLCDHAMLESIYKGFTEKMRFSELKRRQASREPLEKRICSYRDFLRRSLLFGQTNLSTEFLNDIETIKKLGLF